MGNSELLNDELLRVCFPFSYCCEYVHSLISESIKKDSDRWLAETCKNFEPYTKEDLKIFLDMCVSWVFFLHKNKINGYNHQQDTTTFSNILIDSDNCKGGFRLLGKTGLLRSSLYFTPFTSSSEFDLSIRFIDLSQKDSKTYKKRKKHTVEYTCDLDGYSEETYLQLPFNPREIGFNLETSAINLKNFKIEKYLTKDNYPLYMNIPYIEDYVNYKYCN